MFRRSASASSPVVARRDRSRIDAFPRLHPLAWLALVAPLLLGGLVYVVFRAESLLMFRWFDAFGLGPAVAWLRVSLGGAGAALPRWFVFSFPDAAWVFSMTALLGVVWRARLGTAEARAWMSLGLLLGAGAELGQAVGLVPGTFDIVDLTLCLSAWLLAVSLARSFTCAESSRLSW
jgi:hypothetical protein